MQLIEKTRNHIGNQNKYKVANESSKEVKN